MGAILIRSSLREKLRCIRFARIHTGCGLRAAKEWIADPRAPFLLVFSDLIAKEAELKAEYEKYYQSTSRVFPEPAIPFIPEKLTPRVLDDFCLSLMEVGEDVDILTDDEALVWEVQDG